MKLPLWLNPLLGLVTIFALTAPLLVSSSTSAQTIVPPVSESGNLLFGQKHAYTVIFRNDGAATVLGRIVFKNTDHTPIKELKLTVPDVTVSDPIFYQIKPRPQCIEYLPQPVGDAPSCAKSSIDYLYTNFEYLSNEEYTKIVPGQDKNVFTVPLAQEVAENEPGGIVFAFRSRDYTKSTWSGAFTFTFLSPHTTSPAALVRVAVGVDSDLYLKGRQAKVAYKEEMPAVSDLTAPSIGRTIDYYQRQGFTKEGRNLGSGESLAVRGVFADQWWRLYAKEIVWTLIVIGVAVLAWLWWRRYYHPIHQKAGPLTGILTPGNVGLGFASALGTVALSYVISTFIPQHFFFRDQITALLFSIIIFGLYLSVIFGPALWVAFDRRRSGHERAWQHFLFILFVELLFLALLLAVYVNIVPQTRDYPVPLEGGYGYSRRICSIILLTDCHKLI